MKQTKLKTILSYLPEASFIIMAFLWFMDNLMATPSHVNYYMIAVVVFILALVIFRVKAFALVLSIILGIGSLFMLLAVLSEFNEFPNGSIEGMKLLFTGLLIFITLGVMAVIMPIKYFRIK